MCVILSGLPVFAQAGEQAGLTPPLIEVVVTDTDGLPIFGAEVAWASAAATYGRARRRPQPEELQTDPNGRCLIELPSAGAFRVAVRREGYLDADNPSQFEHSEVLQVDPGKTVRLFVDLLRAASFQGTVYLDNGQRVAGATVRLQAASLTWAGTAWGAAPKLLTARTDAQGNYSFPAVPPAGYGMWIALPARIVNESMKKNDRGEWTGYGSVVWHTSVEEMRRIVPVNIAPGEDMRGYNVVLRKTKVYPLKRTLREWSGKPALRAEVSVRAETEMPITLLEPRPVDALTGDFDFPALPEGRYSLVVYRDDAPDAPPYVIPIQDHEASHGPQRDIALIPPSELRQIDSIPPWAVVAGHVAVLRTDMLAVGNPAAQGAPNPPAASVNPDEQPAPVQVLLTRVGPGSSSPSDSMRLESSVASGRNSMEFPATALPPGDYQFDVQIPEPWYVVSARWEDADLLEKPILSLAARRYDRPAQFAVEIRHGGIALEGLVVNDKGEPLSNGAMCALAGKPARARQPGGAFCVRADSSGAFRSRWMSPGEWTLWAFSRKPHEDPSSQAFQKRYERQGRLLTVPEDGRLGRLSLAVIE